jgi:hypothetical protein
MAAVLKKRTALCVTSLSSSSIAASKHLLYIFYFTGISLMMPCVGKWSWCNGDVPLPEHCPVMPIYSDSRQSNILCGTCADLTREGGGELLLSSVGPRCAGRALLLTGLFGCQNAYGRPAGLPPAVRETL